MHWQGCSPRHKQQHSPTAKTKTHGVKLAMSDWKSASKA